MTITRIDFTKIEDAMAANRWSARQLGLSAGVSGEAITAWINGKSVPSALNLKRICDILGVPIESVFVDSEAEGVSA